MGKGRKIERSEDGKIDRYISFVKIAPLNHEILDNTMEGRALIPKALLSGAEGTEVFGCLGNIVAVQSNDNPSDKLPNWISDTDVEEYFLSHFGLNTCVLPRRRTRPNPQTPSNFPFSHTQFHSMTTAKPRRPRPKLEVIGIRVREVQTFDISKI